MSLPKNMANGEMAEWTKAVASKAIIPKGIRGSNPLLSAKIFVINKALYNRNLGEVREWLKRRAWRARVAVRLSRVRIPASPF